MNQSRGFSLIELLMALAIAGILFAVALPAYNDYVVRSHRADAHGALLDISARQERFMAQNNTYTTEVQGAGGLNMGTSTSSAEYYDMSVAACGTASGRPRIKASICRRSHCLTRSYPDSRISPSVSRSIRQTSIQ